MEGAKMIVQKSCVFIKIEAKTYRVQKMKSEQWEHTQGEHKMNQSCCTYKYRTTKELHYPVSMRRKVLASIRMKWEIYIYWNRFSFHSQNVFK